MRLLLRPVGRTLRELRLGGRRRHDSHQADFQRGRLHRRGAPFCVGRHANATTAVSPAPSAQDLQARATALGTPAQEPSPLDLRVPGPVPVRARREGPLPTAKTSQTKDTLLVELSTPARLSLPIFCLHFEHCRTHGCAVKGWPVNDPFTNHAGAKHSAGPSSKTSTT